MSLLQSGKTYYIVSDYLGSVIDISSDTGNTITCWPKGGTDNQKWTVRWLGADSYQIYNASYNLYLTPGVPKSTEFGDIYSLVAKPEPYNWIAILIPPGRYNSDKRPKYVIYTNFGDQIFRIFGPVKDRQLISVNPILKDVNVHEAWIFEDA